LFASGSLLETEVTGTSSIGGKRTVCLKISHLSLAIVIDKVLLIQDIFEILLNLIKVDMLVSLQP
jgi:hypothetical protein